MIVVLLAGGRGSRFSEETEFRPKPMIEIGGHPILWHIMMIYSKFGLHDFIVCLGYKGFIIKEFFLNYVQHRSDLLVDLGSGTVRPMTGSPTPPWRIRLIDTGLETMTGGRLKRIAHLLRPDEPFCMTYGDGLADIDIDSLLAFHARTGLQATVTAARPSGRYGALTIEGNRITSFAEKRDRRSEYINGGFFVLHPEVISRISGDDIPFEGPPLEGLAAEGQLAAFRHDGFWHAMDTMRDRLLLEQLWSSGAAPWKVWDEA